MVSVSTVEQRKEFKANRGSFDVSGVKIDEKLKFKVVLDSKGCSHPSSQVYLIKLAELWTSGQ